MAKALSREPSFQVLGILALLLQFVGLCSLHDPLGPPYRIFDCTDCRRNSFPAIMLSESTGSKAISAPIVAVIQPPYERLEGFSGVWANTEVVVCMG